MAEIIINEISSNYGYNVSAADYCTVALPITACWGPAFEDPNAAGVTLDQELEASAFLHFPASQSGLQSFVATFRGPVSNYRTAKDYSYQLAITLLNAGYDLDVCRLSAGAHAQAVLTQQVGEGETAGSITFRAKHPGTFGNNLAISFKKLANYGYWNLITYVVDELGNKTALENLVFVLDIENSTDTILHVSEISSAFVDIIVDKIASDNVTFTASELALAGGSDRAAATTASEMMDDAIALATARYNSVPAADGTQYLAVLNQFKASNPDATTAAIVKDREWIYRYTMEVLTILTDKLAYTSNRIILPGWDDQDIQNFTGETVLHMDSISPLHARMMEVAYDARCATAFLDIPRSLAREGVYNQSSEPNVEGYAQKVARYEPSGRTVNMFSSHSALFAPWGKYRYAGTGKDQIAPPSFLALMIQRGMIINQANQYEWAMPTTRQHDVVVGKLDYVVPKKLLDEWQSIEGVALNVIADIPDLGISVWGNSTLMEVPVASYNALQNLSTRFLMNAVKNVAYRCGLSITFQYNNNEAYAKFYVGMSPTLDTMQQLGAITDYKIEMSADVDGLDSVNLNSVIGKVTLYVAGVVNNITIDLVALPAV